MSPVRACALALLVVVCAVAVSAQIPIPNRLDGWQIGGPITAPVQIDAHFDLLCPDCAAAWPNIKQVIDHYGQQLAVNVHMFPLPYHTNAFVVSQAAHAAVAYGAKARDVADVVFGFQAAFWNAPTANHTFQDVQTVLGKLMVKFNLITQDNYDKGMNSSDVNEDTRVSWKYSCTRGVAGTPTFFINQVLVGADASWALKDWQSVLDPIINAKAVQTPAAAATAVMSPSTLCSLRRAFVGSTQIKATNTCPPTQPTCEYLPGKVECCLAGEGCIPNVGCRC